MESGLQEVLNGGRERREERGLQEVLNGGREKGGKEVCRKCEMGVASRV
jgi:hypothetical protein